MQLEEENQQVVSLPLSFNLELILVFQIEILYNDKITVYSNNP